MAELDQENSVETEVNQSEVSADNSPREWPATKSGLKSFFSSILLITENIKMAGWVFFVFFKSSELPSNITFEISNCIILSAILKSFLLTSEYSYSFLPMPICWEPCPGKTNAFI